MTQVKDMKDQELNRALAELMGYTVVDMKWMGLHQFLKDGIEISRLPSEVYAWADAPDYCTDPAASLEVQAKALELNYKAYIDHLDEFVNTDELTICSEPSYRAIASLLLASPRERAEAAYVTLQGEK